MVTSDTKLIWNRQTGEPLLFDRLDDRSEMRNLSTQKPVVTKALMGPP